MATRWDDPTNNQMQRVAKLVMIEMGGHRQQIWNLSGKHKAGGRAHILTEATGATKHIPQSKAGITALIQALYALYCVSGDCEASREEALLDAIEYHSA